MNIKETTVSLWGVTSKFTPVLLDEIFGDGGKIAIFQTMDDRPNFWLVKVDSKTDFDNDDNSELLEEVWSSLESEFGERWPTEDENGNPLTEEVENDYPALSSQCGSSLGDITDSYKEELGISS